MKAVVHHPLWGNCFLDSIVKPHHATFQCFGGEVSKRLTSCRLFFSAACVLKDGWNTGQAIDARIHEQADFVDQTCFHKKSIYPTPPLNDARFYAQYFPA